jgi:hypothetical protein
MTIILTNNSTENIIISDLGIELNPSGVMDLYASYSLQELLDSKYIAPLFASSQSFTISIDGTNIIDYPTFVADLTFLTQAQHESLPTLRHQEYETYFFETTKVNNLTNFITYYQDNTKSLKSREEIINRDANGTVLSITTNQYDVSGTLVFTKTETLNRDASGRVISTTMA